MSFPKKIVYDIHDARAGGHIGCRLKDNTLLHCKPKAFRIRSPRAGPNNIHPRGHFYRVKKGDILKEV